MPRGRPKGSKNRKPEAETETIKPEDLKPMISASKLKRLAAAKRALTKDTAEMNGTFGQMKREMIENDHLHPRAFNIYAMLDKMENEKMADLWDNLLYMMDIGGLDKRIKSVMRMNLGERNADDGRDEEDDNVTHLVPKDAA